MKEREKRLSVLWEKKLSPHLVKNARYKCRYINRENERDKKKETKLSLKKERKRDKERKKERKKRDKKKERKRGREGERERGREREREREKESERERAREQFSKKKTDSKRTWLEKGSIKTRKGWWEESQTESPNMHSGPLSRGDTKEEPTRTRGNANSWR